MPACRTNKVNDKTVILPPFPQRQKLETPETLKDYAYVILYYEALVQEWEAWGQTVTDIIGEAQNETIRKRNQKN